MKMTLSHQFFLPNALCFVQFLLLICPIYTSSLRFETLISFFSPLFAVIRDDARQEETKFKILY